MSYDVVAVGELLADLAETGKNEAGYPVFSANPGGAPANFLAALAHLGKRTALIGKVGCDAFGDRLIGTLEEAGIGTAGILRDPEVFTTLAFVTLDETGDRSFSFARKPGADMMLRKEEIPFGMIDEARVLHFGTLSLTDEPARSATKAAVAYAKEHGKFITFDPNYRAPLWASEEAAKEQMLWGLDQADMVKMSLEEAQLLWGCGCTAMQAADRLVKEMGKTFVYVTMGGDGACFESRGERGYVSYKGELQVTDTTGAGDIFGGTALSVLLDAHVDSGESRGEGSGAPGEARPPSLTAAVYACAAASLSVERRGGITSVPARPEIERHLEFVRISITD
ncbi:MAG: carbohydrate kinase [Lachnospiraceae bacterium]|nr:carbohydrate kinase [Lachnospiraceae bacterium]